MLYFFYGDDWRASLNEVNKTIGQFGKETIQSGHIVFDLEEAPVEVLENVLVSNSLFSNRQLLVLKHLFGAPHAHDFFVNNIKRFRDSDDVFIVWERGRLDGAVVKTEAMKTLLANSHSKEFRLKLRDKAPLPPRRMIYEFVDAWVGKDRPRAIYLFHVLIANGVGPEELFWALVWQIRNILAVASLLKEHMNAEDIKRTTGLHPFVVKKSIAQNRTTPHGFPATSLAKLRVIDERVKRESAKLEELLLHFLLTT
ncbi:MAG: hypothetical protein A3C80_04205 [Candidatus Ryanbacteria bacterium RIFCSPHIGHO2_02_FULL_45_43]|uniref:DNA-directed DNA polymerase n=1 Tax=Candidatus Ryanbacteria bacterium RIFCSPHIGHO2_01_45_13 TaxID=1802112 RepID=A0A1G2FYA3_9BACT|nr:MAG: hypothetical protein A2718_00235 [Candidatus Ryanbacteria bacterium RIFCSPHIGHO2_01_FULL_44_130]OGZ42817.1 MAG: hypothetical protein A2W41_00675 [Candidatus Ryanbacteria bacterium RIFCSPHIGHO2_01_45_13]OGZ48237.1 MAG: hypothetical protein A3C80_04205 [Candidatus Ryanbacteria bacterium RIFCSPHIGHO2_02_FULL_45_43]OGZ50013.1 MAG: hypothetical protein A3E55_01865 [Candidatus Ryanbacteria bacterium RIFCSPHIGHO2_12_FULL_44_20]OGZ51472.1 MAG: hypothetical protein A3A17_01815 [Candidatus Ryanba